jgi:hypothetical protein
MLKIEAICSSETPIAFQRTTRSYILEDSTLHLHQILENVSATVSSTTCLVNFVGNNKELYNINNYSLFFILEVLKNLFPRRYNMTSFQPSKIHVNSHSSRQWKVWPPLFWLFYICCRKFWVLVGYWELFVWLHQSFYSISLYRMISPLAVWSSHCLKLCQNQYGL